MIKLIYNINRKNTILKENIRRKFQEVVKLNFGLFVLKLMKLYGSNLECILNNLLIN